MKASQVPRGQALSAVRKATDYRLAGSLFVVGGMLFLLLTTASEAIYPSFSMDDNAISDLAAIGTRTTAVEGTAILGLSVCWLLGTYCLFRRTQSRGLMILNLLPGVGFLVAGLSPENVNLTIHSAGTVAFPLGAIAAIVSYRTIRSSFRYISVILGAVSLLSTFIIFFGWRVVCGTCGYQQGMNDLLLGLGGWESMIIYPLLIWLVGFGSYLLATAEGHPIEHR
jgi:hypothetical membrane protein